MYEAYNKIGNPSEDMEEISKLTFSTLITITACFS